MVNNGGKPSKRNYKMVKTVKWWEKPRDCVGCSLNSEKEVVFVEGVDSHTNSLVKLDGKFVE